MNVTITRSESITKLAGALSKAQSKMPPVKKDANNPHFKSDYATLASILDACREHLTTNGLSVLQFPQGDSGHLGVATLLMHDSGEWVQSEVYVKMSQETNPQVAGSIITYLRKYTLQAIAMVAPIEDDDDGEKGRKASESASHSLQSKEGKTEEKKAEPSKPRDTAAMLRLIHVLMKKGGIEDEAQKREYAEILLTREKDSIKHLSELSWEDCKALIDKLQKG